VTASTAPLHIVGRRPVVAPQQLVAALVPPAHFAEATLASYRPDPAFASQAQALEIVSDFAATVRRRRDRRGARRTAGTGLYLDGGFGVGKTHLLAAVAHAVGDGVAFGTFVQYTQLVGAWGFVQARDALTDFAVVCIDEFELDDPGDTLIMARLMRELTDAGTCLVATSNTLPESLGEGRFAAADFRREIQAVASVFTTVSIDGPDYRHRGELEFVHSDEADLAAVAHATGGVVERWDALVTDLAQVHPSRYGAYVEGVRVLGLSDVTQVSDHNTALRVVTFVDRLYDNDVRVVATGLDLGDVFAPPMLRSGYRKKYLRALSRLAAMTAFRV